MRYHTNEATDTKREQTKLRNRALADRKKASGLVRVMVWVPDGCADQIRSMASRLIGEASDE